MEQNNETNATGSRRLSRVFTKKRLGGLAAVIALILLAGGGATYYQQTQARAAHAQERAAMSQLNAIQAEKMGVTLLKEAQIRSIAADAIGQEETTVTFDEIDLMTGRQARAGKEKEQERRDGRKKEQPKEARVHARAQQPDQARAGAPEDGSAARGDKAPGERAARRANAPAASAGGEHPAPILPPGAGNAPEGSAPEGTPRPRFAPDPHFTYLVQCTAGGMHYTLCIDAVSGQVFPQSVRAAR
jgi:hypothetical protein